MQIRSGSVGERHLRDHGDELIGARQRHNLAGGRARRAGVWRRGGK
jgi:hypothetical protein